jgi:hypothetical protein
MAVVGVAPLRPVLEESSSALSRTIAGYFRRRAIGYFHPRVAQETSRGSSQIHPRGPT